MAAQCVVPRPAARGAGGRQSPARPTPSFLELAWACFHTRAAIKNVDSWLQYNIMLYDLFKLFLLFGKEPLVFIITKLLL